MSSIHAVIYIPGLGDSRVRGQQIAVNAWKARGVEPYLFQMNWMDGEAFEPKINRLLALVDKLDGEGKRVSLIAASAGASAALNAYALRQDKINGVVSICGKLSGRGIASVHPGLYQRNPAFHESMQRLTASEAQLDYDARQRILSMHPIFDESVPVSETKLPGTIPRRMPVTGHFFGIAYGLTAGSLAALRFLKQLPRKQATAHQPASV